MVGCWLSVVAWCGLIVVLVLIVADWLVGGGCLPLVVWGGDLVALSNCGYCCFAMLVIWFDCDYEFVAYGVLTCRFEVVVMMLCCMGACY